LLMKARCASVGDSDHLALFTARSCRTYALYQFATFGTVPQMTHFGILT